MITVLNQIEKDFIIYITYIDRKILVYLIYKTQIVLLINKKKFVLAKYSHFANIIFKKIIIKLFKKSDIN